MLSRILSAFQDGNRKFPLRYLRMTTCIADRMCLARNRYLLAHPIQTAGVELLRFLILNLDIDALDEYNSDADRYTEVIKFFKDTYRTSFDPVFSNTIAGGKWIKRTDGGPNPSEIILNCESENPLAELPLDKDWSEWQTLRAFRLVYHNSLELPENFYRSVFDFSRDYPSFLLLSLDVPILLFKYYKYVKDCQESHQSVDTNYFIKEFEYSHLFDDLYDIWQFNLVSFVFRYPDRSVDEILEQVTVPMRYCTTNMLRQGIEGIKEFVALLRSGAMKPQDFLDTKWFNGKSLKERIQYLNRWITLPSIQRYLWLKCLMWFPYLYIILASCKLFPDTPFTATIWTRCLEIWNTKFRHIYMPSAVVNPKLGDFIKSFQDVIEMVLMGEDDQMVETTQETL